MARRAVEAVGTSLAAQTFGISRGCLTPERPDLLPRLLHCGRDGQTAPERNAHLTRAGGLGRPLALPERVLVCCLPPVPPARARDPERHEGRLRRLEPAAGDAGPVPAVHGVTLRDGGRGDAQQTPHVLPGAAFQGEWAHMCESRGLCLPREVPLALRDGVMALPARVMSPARARRVCPCGDRWVPTRVLGSKFEVDVRAWALASRRRASAVSPMFCACCDAPRRSLRIQFDELCHVWLADGPPASRRTGGGSACRCRPMWGTQGTPASHRLAFLVD